MSKCLRYASTTTSVLLNDLQDAANQEVWHEFDARYRPILVAIIRRLGFDTLEAEEVAQDTLVRFVEEFRAGKYDRDRGRLRSWIIGIARNRAAEHGRQRARRRADRGDSVLVTLPDDSELAELWEAERRAEILRQAMAELRASSNIQDRTFRAFELFALGKRPAAEVAAQLKMRPADVYVAKNRVTAKLRDILQRLEDCYDDG